MPLVVLADEVVLGFAEDRGVVKDEVEAGEGEIADAGLDFGVVPNVVGFEIEVLDVVADAGADIGLEHVAGIERPGDGGFEGDDFHGVVVVAEEIGAEIGGTGLDAETASDGGAEPDAASVEIIVVLAVPIGPEDADAGLGDGEDEENQTNQNNPLFHDGTP